MSVETDPTDNDSVDTWQPNHHRPANFVAWLASQCTLPSAVGPSPPNLIVIDESGRCPSRNASTAVLANSEDEIESMDVDSLPPLTRDNSNASSPTLDTDMASVVEGGFLLESQDGVLTVPARRRPPPGSWLCPFQVLECDRRLTTVVDFKVHVFSHFHGHPLPSYAPCFLCDDLFVRSPLEDPSMAWNEMLAHMVHGHLETGQEFAVFHPPLAVMRYLWNLDVITDAEFTRCQLAALPVRLGAVSGERDSSPLPEAPVAPTAATPPSPVRAYWRQSVGDQSEAFVNIAGSRRERRQRQSRPYLSPVRVNG